MKTIHGLIALDVDGTLTTSLLSIPDQVVDYLKRLSQKGWAIALITGRTFSFVKPICDKLDFHFYLAIQNGADILEMPGKKLLRRAYLSPDAVGLVEAAYRSMHEDFIVYSGYEKGDFCYFRPKKFSPTFLAYLERLKQFSHEPWQAMDSFKQLPQNGDFSLLRCFGYERDMAHLYQQLRPLKLHTSFIRDSVSKSFFLNLVTHQDAHKGAALDTLTERLQPAYVIAAGDDRNDLPMLERAHYRIVMADAPEEIKSLAHCIAASSEQMGIIKALEKAVAACA